jgi:hypothetical protein
MHLVDAKRWVEIQVMRLYRENIMTSSEIARYLNRVNPHKFKQSSMVIFFKRY